MKRIIYILSILLSLVITDFIFAQNNSIHISGNIKDKITGVNLFQVKIYATNNSGTINDSTTTNPLGNWEIEIPVSSVGENPGVPASFEVSQNYPNPFNPSTKVDIALPSAANVSVTIYNALGETIDRYEEYLNQGSYSIEWHARGSAGVYFLNVKTGSGSITKKMVLLDGGYGSGLSGFRAGGNSTNNINRFNKTTSPVEIKIRASKFAYVSVVLDTIITGSEHFEFKLESIHSYSRLIDLHNDILEKMVIDTSYHLADFHTYNHTDIPRMITGGIDAQLFAVWVDPSSHGNNSYNHAMDMVNIFHNEIALNNEKIGQARTAEEVIQLNNENKIAAILAVEGGHAIENDIQKLKNFYDEGMRYLTITWNNSLDWAVSAQDPRSATVGLSEFGKDVIRTLDSLGVMIDVSHTGIKTIEDILTITTNPILATHSGVRAIRNHYRNLYDDQIAAIALSGGVIGIVFYPPFLSNSSTVNIAKVVDHIDYIVNLVGIDHVAVGSDFDGIGTNTVIGLEDISKYPNLTMELLNRGYTQNEIEKILGGNFMRVFEQVTGSKKTINKNLQQRTVLN